MFSATENGNKNDSCKTNDTLPRTCPNRTSRKSRPSNKTRPPSGSKNRGNNPTNVDFPAPVGPTTATTSPGHTEKLTPLNTGRPTSYPNTTSSPTTPPPTTRHTTPPPPPP